MTRSVCGSIRILARVQVQPRGRAGCPGPRRHGPATRPTTSASAKLERGVGWCRQQHDAVGERHRLDLVVGDVDHGLAEPLVQPLDLGAHLVAQLGIEVGERLVEQEQARGRARWRGRSRRAGAGRPRAGAAGARAAARCRACRRRGDPRVDLGLRRLARAGRRRCSRTRSCRGRARSSGTPWRCRGRAGAWPLTTSPSIAIVAAVGVLEPGDGAQQRALAAARGPDEDAELALGDVEVDAAQRMHPAVALLQAAEVRRAIRLALHRAQRDAAHQVALQVATAMKIGIVPSTAHGGDLGPEVRLAAEIVASPAPGRW